MAILQGFAKHRERGGVLGRGGGLRQNLGCGCPPTPHIYIGARERGAGPLRSNLRRGRRPRGEECLPSQVEASPLGFYPSHAHGPWGGWCPWPIKARAPPTAHATVLDVVEQFPDLRTPPESSGTFWKLPGTIPKKPELFPETEQQLSIYKSLPPEHSGTPRDVRDLIRDSEQHSVTTYKLPL